MNRRHIDDAEEDEDVRTSPSALRPEAPRGQPVCLEEMIFGSGRPGIELARQRRGSDVLLVMLALVCLAGDDRQTREVAQVATRFGITRQGRPPRGRGWHHDCRRRITGVGEFPEYPQERTSGTVATHYPLGSIQ